MSETRQANYRLPDDVRLWIRREAAEREVQPATVVTDLVRAEVDRRGAERPEDGQ